MDKTNTQILNIAVPAIVSNITVPLLGLVDVAIVGHLGSAAYIGAIAVGGMTFNVIYWVLGFLRMGTSGLTGQALGKRNLCEALRVLTRSVGVALALSLLLIVLQKPLLSLSMSIMQPSEEVRAFASTYFLILIYGAPAMVGLFSLSGWLIGMQNSRTPMLVAITQNIVNITASTFLVFGTGMKVEGVAIGTLTAQWAGFIMASVMCIRNYGRLRKYFRWSGVWQREAIKHFFSVNRDIFLRTLCLVSVMLFFTSAGSWQGDTVLAVNTLLMQFYILFSYVMDGFAYAGEALGGRYYGARNHSALLNVTRMLFRWGAAMAVLFTMVYGLGGDAFLSLLTDEPSVVSASHSYFLWAMAIPAASVAAIVWDGLFIGCTKTRGMLVSMAFASATFFILYFALRTSFGNHGLWAAFIAYLFMRGLAQSVIFKTAK